MCLIGEETVKIDGEMSGFFVAEKRTDDENEREKEGTFWRNRGRPLAGNSQPTLLAYDVVRIKLPIRRILSQALLQVSEEDKRYVRMTTGRRLNKDSDYTMLVETILSI